LAGITFFYILPQHVLPYLILQPQRVKDTNTLKTKARDYNDVTLYTSDSIILKGYRVKSNIDTTYASIILVHGIGSCKEHFTDLAIDLSDRGYETWLFDNRAHGESGGQYTTYGFIEKQDISDIVDEIKEENPETKIGIWGNSLGGAIAIQAMEKEDRIAFGIIESTFTELRQIVLDYQKRYSFGISLKWICDSALDRASDIANFDVEKIKPINSVKNIKRPVLIAHGNNDNNIKFEYGEVLYAHLASKDKEFVIVNNADHYNMCEVGGEDYKNKIVSFLDKLN